MVVVDNFGVFGFVNFLENDLFGGLCINVIKCYRFNFFFVYVIGFEIGVDFFCFLKSEFGV